MIKLEENNIYFYFNKSKLIENFNNFSVLGDVYYPLKTNSNGDIKIEYAKSKVNDFEFSMCGGSSDSGDKIGLMYIDSKYKDELKIGAKFIVKGVGAYFEEFFMPYSNDLKKVFIEV